MKKFIKSTTLAIFSVALAFALCSCGSSSSSDESQSSDTQSEQTQETSYKDSVSDTDTYASGIHHAKVDVKDYGSFTIKLDADVAPITVSNFCKLAQSGFYSALTFHRAVKDFCLQGGDPSADGTGGSTQTNKGEFSSNKVKNKLADNYKRGVVAMARATDPNSASSQFFITLSDDAASSLNGEYAAFGTINKAGMKVVDKITKKALKKADATTGTIENIADQPLISSITITD